MKKNKQLEERRTLIASKEKEHNRLRLDEAILRARLKGDKPDNKDLAPDLFPSESNLSSQGSFYKYKDGTSSFVNRGMVLRICKRLGTNPCELFGWPE